MSYEHLQHELAGVASEVCLLREALVRQSKSVDRADLNLTERVAGCESAIVKLTIAFDKLQGMVEHALLEMETDNA